MTNHLGSYFYWSPLNLNVRIYMFVECEISPVSSYVEIFWSPNGEWYCFRKFSGIRNQGPLLFLSLIGFLFYQPMHLQCKLQPPWRQLLPSLYFYYWLWSLNKLPDNLGPPHMLSCTNKPLASMQWGASPWPPLFSYHGVHLESHCETDMNHTLFEGIYTTKQVCLWVNFQMQSFVCHLWPMFDFVCIWWKLCVSWEETYSDEKFIEFSSFK